MQLCRNWFKLMWQNKKFRQYKKFRQFFKYQDSYSLKLEQVFMQKQTKFQDIARTERRYAFITECAFNRKH